MSDSPNQQSNQYFPSRSTSISEITRHLKELVAKKEACALKWEQLISDRGNRDIERLLLRKEEDDKHNAVLARRTSEDEQIKKSRAAEASDMDRLQKALKEEIVSTFPAFR